MMIKVVVFDMDGVLANSKKAYVDTIQEVLSKHGLFFTKKYISDSLGLRLSNTLRNIKRFPPKLFKGLREEVHDAVFFKAKRLKQCPNVKEILEYLKKDGKNLVLLTNSRRSYALSFLDKHKLKKYFSLVVGGDQFDNKKNALKKIFIKYKINPKEAVYVGDREGDWKTAKKVGCGSVLVYHCSWEKDKINKKGYKESRINDLRGLKRHI